MCMVQLPSNLWACTKCDYVQVLKKNVYQHVDSKHMDFQYPCQECDKMLPTRHALREHFRRLHKQTQFNF